MKRVSLLLVLALGIMTGCTKKLQSDSPKRDSTGAGSSASEGYKEDNKNTPSAPSRTPEQGTGTNTGDGKDNAPNTNTSTPGTDKPGQGPSSGQSNETTPRRGKH